MDLIFTENDVRRAIQTGKFLSITDGNVNAAARKNMADTAEQVLRLIQAVQPMQAL